MKCCVPFLLAIIVSIQCAAQVSQSKLNGRVIDNTGNKLSSATVSLRDSLRFQKTMTTADGQFALIADTGTYEITVSHIGFSDWREVITIQEGDLFLDSIVLLPIPKLMQAVKIEGSRPLIEQADDKLIYNVEADPAARSQTATDLLRKTPMVTVDGSGNVQLNGQSNFKILLNGRETALFARNSQDALRNFPGAVISKIEIITSASAKYDAEGVGGLINIVTKKKVMGYNGYLSSYYSTLSNYSESAAVNMKTGRLGVSAYFGITGTVNPIGSRTFSETLPFNAFAYTSRTISGELGTRNTGAYGNIEVTYDMDSLKVIALYGNLGNTQNRNQANQIIFTKYLSQETDSSYFLQAGTTSSGNVGVGADFIKKFRNHPDQEFSVRVNGQFSRNKQVSNSLQDGSLADRFVRNQSSAPNEEYTVQVDYIKPLRPRQKIETGFKTIIRRAAADYQQFLKYNGSDSFELSRANSDLFNYDQQVYSVYGSFSFPVKKWFFRLGLRGEHTAVKGNFVSSFTTVRQAYVNMMPNLFVTKQLTENQRLTGSYNLRLQRPYITSLNPFVQNNDSLNISFGNPELGPQTLHIASVQHRITRGKSFMSVYLNASYSGNAIIMSQSYEASKGIISTSSYNAGKEVQLALGLSASRPFGSKLTAGLNALARYNQVQNIMNNLEQNKGTGGMLVGNFQYKVISEFTISGSGGLSRAVYTLIASPATNYFYQVNFGYRLLKKKLAVTMNVNNFHGKYITYRSQVLNNYFRNITMSTAPFRVIYFGATYNFGKLKETVSRKKGVNNDDLLQ